MLSAETLRRGVPTSLLMGCSSARLKAPHAVTNVGAPTRPAGAAAVAGPLAACLAAGSPCVVANLWDVTDRDIDRFTAALLQQCAPRTCERQIKLSPVWARSATSWPVTTAHQMSGNAMSPCSCHDALLMQLAPALS